MRYLGWAAYYEGPTDALYLDVLLPRLLRDIIAHHGTDFVDLPDGPTIRFGERNRSVEDVAREACASRAAFDLIFVHADTGGRGLERGLFDRAGAYCTAMNRLCDWPTDHCITITPRHETEAWLLADPAAVMDALGYRGRAADVGLPRDARQAERLGDPKETLRAAIERIAGARRARGIDNIFPAIAQRQQLDHLRRSESFGRFEARLRDCLRSLRCID